MSLYLTLFKALNDADVQYIVVGGVATILHGYVRATADVDLVVNLQVDEASKVISVLTAEGFKPKIPVQALEFADEKKREMKRQAGRLKDLADIEQLTKIKEYEKDRSGE